MIKLKEIVTVFLLFLGIMTLLLVACTRPTPGAGGGGGAADASVAVGIPTPEASGDGTATDAGSAVGIPNPSAGADTSKGDENDSGVIGSTESRDSAIIAALPACNTPANWIPYLIQPGDTLTQLAQESGATVVDIQRNNCLANALIFVDDTIYLPTLPAIAQLEPSAEPVVLPSVTTPATVIVNIDPSGVVTPSAPPSVITPVVEDEPEPKSGGINLVWLVWLGLFILLVGVIIWVGVRQQNGS